jgi:hypothetical protein
MTAIGGLGHTFPYLIPNFWTATSIAIVVVAAELAVIFLSGIVSWTRRWQRRID